MTIEKTGGAFLLQEAKPSKLVGSLVSGVDADGAGWIQLSFYPEPGILALLRRGERIEGSMSRPIGMALIAVLHVLLAQVRWLRPAGYTHAAEAALSEAELSFRIDREAAFFSWDAGNREVTFTEVNGQIELRMFERFAFAMASGLADAFGRFAAGGSPT